jgi:hypothetical protein
LLTPAYGKLLAHLANGGVMNLPGTPRTWLGAARGIVLAMVLAMFMRETGPRERARLYAHRMHERVARAIRSLREYDSNKLADARFKCEEN